MISEIMKIAKGGREGGVISTDLIMCWSGDAYLETATLQRWNHFTSGVTTQNQTTRGHVHLHSPTERVLSILR